ncbi:MAG TPA: hypothetical protein VKY19_04335 [Ktedonosporobacter sp.]|jgi:hypothetical protein|nr:hypothetical protein [Ktedonosporobacter sp.]
MLQPDPQVDNALQVTLERLQDIASQERSVKDAAVKTIASLRFLVQQITTSSQITPTQHVQFQSLLALLDALPWEDFTHKRQQATSQAQTADQPEIQRSKAYALLNVRDINMICQEYGDVYAMIEGEKRRRKINRARRRLGVLEIRTAAHDEWKGPVAWVEWTNDLGKLIRYLEQDIR